MKALLPALPAVLPALSWAGVSGAPTQRVPEPGMWALVGIAVVAVAVAQFLGRK